MLTFSLCTLLSWPWQYSDAVKLLSTLKVIGVHGLHIWYAYFSGKFPGNNPWGTIMASYNPISINFECYFTIAVSNLIELLST